jgi:phage shock protein PspC (stress-responsive transcriptional regulator)
VGGGTAQRQLGPIATEVATTSSCDPDNTHLGVIMSLADDLHRLEELHQRGSLDAEEFARAKARLLGAPAATPAAAINQFRRSRSDRWIAGVCGGLARLTDTESWIWRLAVTLLVLVGGTGFLLYLLLWIFVPVEGE